jgi:hypothetical protein
MTVTVSFWALHDEANRVRTFIYQDAPEFRTDGEFADFPPYEVLELLHRLGASDRHSQNVLELVLWQPGVQRRQFILNVAQEAQARLFLSGNW